MGKRIITCILLSVAFFALLLSSSSGLVVHALANDSSSNSTIALAQTVLSNMTTSTTSSASSSITDRTTSILTVDSTTSNSLSTTTTSLTSSGSIATTSTNTMSSFTSWTSTTTYSSSSTYTNWSTVTVTGTTTAAVISETNTTTIDPPVYAITFSPQYWYCAPISVSFTGPLVESGYYGDNLQFQYYQYSPDYPSVLNPIFTDSGLTVTSDMVNYWVGYNEYAPVNFAYMPDLAVKVIDVTPHSNGAPPGLLYMDLTNTSPQSSQSCGYDPAIPTPEFQADWLVILASVLLSLVILRVHKHQHRQLGNKSNSLETQEPSSRTRLGQ